MTKNYSYSASCYIDNVDGQYNMDCYMNYDDKEIHAKYDGENFVDGLNKIMDDMMAQMFEEPEPEESLEEKVARLEKLVDQLQTENESLKAANKTCCDNKIEINDADITKYLGDILNKFLDQN